VQFVTFRASRVTAVHFRGPFGRNAMNPRRRLETPIERIYREVNGRDMPPAIKRILLRKPKAKPKAT
jgi:hypothetical protein